MYTIRSQRLAHPLTGIQTPASTRDGRLLRRRSKTEPPPHPLPRPNVCIAQIDSTSPPTTPARDHGLTTSTRKSTPNLPPSPLREFQPSARQPRHASSPLAPLASSCTLLPDHESPAIQNCLACPGPPAPIALSYFALKSCLNTVKFCVNLSLFFGSSVRVTSAISLSKHPASRCCWSGGCVASI